MPPEQEIQASQQQQNLASLEQQREQLTAQRQAILNQIEQVSSSPEYNPYSRANTLQYLSGQNNELNAGLYALQTAIDAIRNNPDISLNQAQQFVDEARQNQVRNESISLYNQRLREQERQRQLTNPNPYNFNFTGTIEESGGGQPQATSYFIGGNQVSAQEFAPNIRLKAQEPQYVNVDIGKLGRVETRTPITQQRFTSPIPVFLNPTIYQEFTGEFKIDPDTGEEIPQFKTLYTPGSGGIGEIPTRPATQEEIDLLEKAEAERKANLPPEEKTKYEEFKDYISKEIINPVRRDLNRANVDAKNFLTTVGVTPEIIDIASGKIAKALPDIYGTTQPILGVISKAAYKIPGTEQFVKGAIKGNLIDVYEKPFTNLAIIGAGYGVGYVFEGLPILAKTGFTKIGFPKAALFTARGIKAIEVGTGAVLTTAYALDVGDRLIQADLSAEQRGALAGKELLRTAEFGLGFVGGVKGARITEGYLKTFGRKEFTDIPQEDFPTAPAKEQLKLFQKNIYPELSDRPIAFHTTSQKFVGKKITPLKGSSELPGLYGSTKISRPFAKIPGSGTSKKDFNIFEFINELISVNEPGVAGLVPNEFRYSPTKRISGRPRVPLGYKFVKPAKIGTAEVPLIKGEIESIFRPEAFPKEAPFIFANGKYYVKIKGVRVPLDVYESKIINSNIAKSRTFEPKDYSGVVIPKSTPAYFSYRTILRPTTKSSSTDKKISSISISLSKLVSSSISGSSKPLSSISKSSSVSSGSSFGSSSLISPSLGSSILPTSSPPSGSSIISSPPYILPYYSRKLKDKDTERLRKKRAKAYSVLFKRRGRFVPVRTGLPRGRALFFGASQVQKELSRQFKVVVESGTTELEDISFRPSQRGFRPYKVRRGKRITFEPDRFIQKISNTLQTREEKALIASAKRFRAR